MSRQVEAFRHPSAEELLKRMEKARDERSMFLARLIGLRGDDPHVSHSSAAAQKLDADCAVAA